MILRKITQMSKIDLLEIDQRIVMKEYIAPDIKVEIIEMEQGIASSSAQIVPSGSSNTPTITDWDEQKDEQNWEF